MEKREQISRMAKIIGGCCLVYEDTVCHDQEKHCHCVSEPCVHEITAERLYNAGFKLPDETQENSFSHYLIEELRKHVIHGKQTKVSVNPDLLSDASYHIERLQKRIDMIEKENAIISETLKQVVDEQEASRSTQHFCLNGTYQCWMCANCTGQKAFRNKVVGGDSTIMLPYCKIMDRYMTNVYDNPCREFKAKDKMI